MDNFITETPVDIHTAAVRLGIASAKVGNLEAALSGDVLSSLVALKTNPNGLGGYLTLLTELVASHKAIRKGDIEKLIRELQPNDDKDTGRSSQADEIVALVSDSCTLFTDQEDQAYATIEQDGHREVWSLNSSTFKDWVSMLLYKSAGKTPRAAALADAFSTLHGIAKHDGDKQDVYRRVAEDGNGGYYLDIGDDQWRVIHITTLGWQIINESPVMFRRTKASKAVPIPIAGGRLSDLKSLVNVDSIDDLLLITSLIDFIRPDTAYPVIELIGEQGSGKSTTANNVRRLIDPHTVNLRNAPKSVEDIFVGARNNHLVCLNNLSRLSGDEQDALCNLSTGGGYAGRTLYTNEEETVYEAKRPVILNGINPVATQPDLISRLVRLECPTLDNKGVRLDDNELSLLFDERGPLAMGYLLDTMVATLAILPQIKLNANNKPRLMDFAKLGAAVGRIVEPETGELSFTTRYQESREAASMQALEAMPVITSLIEYLEIHAPYTGNYAGLLKEIDTKIGKTVDAAWPKSGRGLSDAIGRAGPTLNLLGWQITTGERNKRGATVTLQKKPVSAIKTLPEISSTTSTTSTNNVKGAGGAQGAGEIAPINYPRKEKNAAESSQSKQTSLSGGVL